MADPITRRRFARQTALAAGQLDVLVDLSLALMRGLSIDVEHVTTHRGVDGILTQCPGKHFPRERYLRRLREGLAHARREIEADPTQTAAQTARPARRCVW